MPNHQHLVLCVDDETIGLEVRRMLLERAGYRVLTALDGGEVAKRMREVKPTVPILMLSAYTSLPPEVSQSVDLAMTKGEGAPALLRNLGSLISDPASHTS
jgi:CheY-like chemotaxis protein